jgi:feruloyl esterase
VGTGYGFAAMSSDLGHNSTALDATWAYNAPEKVANWGYRALHGSIVIAKEVTRAYYSKDLAYSYYSGCSTGGRQGLKEAEEFPDDFDGIVAGAPAWWTVHLQLWNLKAGLYNLPVDAPNHIPQALFSTIGDEVLNQCDPQDGVTDDIISDPRRCDFHPEALLCAANVTNATAAGCLTSPQIDTLYHLYNDWVEANQTFIFPHFELGSEAQWDLLVGGNEPSTLGTDYVKYMLGLGPDWRWQDFSPDLIALSDKINPGNATANNFDLSPFYQKGGRLLHYHGYADGSVATGSSVYFYNYVLRTLKPKGIQLDDFYRFFLIPGMQ